MRDRASALRAPRRVLVSADLVLVAASGDHLSVLLARAEGRGRERWVVPWDLLRGEDVPDDVARRVCRSAVGGEPSWLEQTGTLGDGRRHPADADLTIGYAGLVPAGASIPVGGTVAWFPATDLPILAPRQAGEVVTALEHVRMRADTAPIAFRLLPPTFTLSELQHVYELLHGRKLHKASFRRALQAAWLVDPVNQWRSEGRGRPAQLFRFAPRKRRGGRRALRFDLLPG